MYIPQECEAHTLDQLIQLGLTDTIPRKALWLHFRCIGIPDPWVAVVQSLYASHEYILKDGEKNS